MNDETSLVEKINSLFLISLTNGNDINSLRPFEDIVRYLVEHDTVYSSNTFVMLRDLIASIYDSLDEFISDLCDNIICNIPIEYDAVRIKENYVDLKNCYLFLLFNFFNKKERIESSIKCLKLAKEILKLESSDQKIYLTLLSLSLKYLPKIDSQRYFREIYEIFNDPFIVSSKYIQVLCENGVIIPRDIIYQQKTIFTGVLHAKKSDITNYIDEETFLENLDDIEAFVDSNSIIDMLIKSENPKSCEYFRKIFKKSNISRIYDAMWSFIKAHDLEIPDEYMDDIIKKYKLSIKDAEYILTHYRKVFECIDEAYILKTLYSSKKTNLLKECDISKFNSLSIYDTNFWKTIVKKYDVSFNTLKLFQKVYLVDPKLVLNMINIWDTDFRILQNFLTRLIKDKIIPSISVFSLDNTCIQFANEKLFIIPLSFWITPFNMKDYSIMTSRLLNNSTYCILHKIFTISTLDSRSTYAMPKGEYKIPHNDKEKLVDFVEGKNFRQNALYLPEYFTEITSMFYYSSALFWNTVYSHKKKNFSLFPPCETDAILFIYIGSSIIDTLDRYKSKSRFHVLLLCPYFLESIKKIINNRDEMEKYYNQMGIIKLLNWISVEIPLCCNDIGFVQTYLEIVELLMKNGYMSPKYRFFVHLCTIFIQSLSQIPNVEIVLVYLCPFIFCFFETFIKYIEYIIIGSQYDLMQLEFKDEILELVRTDNILFNALFLSSFPEAKNKNIGEIREALKFTRMHSLLKLRINIYKVCINSNLNEFLLEEMNYSEFDESILFVSFYLKKRYAYVNITPKFIHWVVKRDIHDIISGFRGYLDQLFCDNDYILMYMNELMKQKSFGYQSLSNIVGSITFLNGKEHLLQEAIYKIYQKVNIVINDETFVPKLSLDIPFKPSDEVICIIEGLLYQAFSNNDNALFIIMILTEVSGYHFLFLRDIQMNIIFDNLLSLCKECYSLNNSYTIRSFKTLCNLICIKGLGVLFIQHTMGLIEKGNYEYIYPILKLYLLFSKMNISQASYSYELIKCGFIKHINKLLSFQSNDQKLANEVTCLSLEIYDSLLRSYNNYTTNLINSLYDSLNHSIHSYFYVFNLKLDLSFICKDKSLIFSESYLYSELMNRPNNIAYIIKNLKKNIYESDKSSISIFLPLGYSSEAFIHLPDVKRLEFLRHAICEPPKTITKFQKILIETKFDNIEKCILAYNNMDNWVELYHILNFVFDMKITLSESKIGRISYPSILKILLTKRMYDTCNVNSLIDSIISELCFKTENAIIVMKYLNDLLDNCFNICDIVNILTIMKSSQDFSLIFSQILLKKLIFQVTNNHIYMNHNTIINVLLLFSELTTVPSEVVDIIIESVINKTPDIAPSVLILYKKMSDNDKRRMNKYLYNYILNTLQEYKGNFPYNVFEIISLLNQKQINSIEPLLLKVLDTLLKNNSTDTNSTIISLLNILCPVRENSSSLLTFSDRYDIKLNKDNFSIPKSLVRSHAFWRILSNNLETVEKIICQHDSIFDIKVINMYPELVSFKIKLSLFQSKYSLSYSDSVINVYINRKSLFTDSLRILLTLKDTKKKIKTVFYNEDAVDEGGVFKEWITLFFNEILSINEYFITNDNGFHTINSSLPICNEYTQVFMAVGKAMGLALIEGIPIPLKLASPYYKYFQSKSFTIRDIKFIDKYLFKSLEFIQNNDVSDLCLFFVFNINNNEIELIENGRNIEVNNENKSRYIELVINNIFNDNAHYLKKIAKGFNEMIEPSKLSIFTHKEIQLALNGEEKIDVENLISSCTYEYPFSSTHSTILMFHSVLKSMNQQQLSKFLQFTTSLSSIPISGNKRFQLTISPGGDPPRLPTSHTCTNMITLPSYPCFDDMRNGLLMAIENCKNFGFA